MKINKKTKLFSALATASTIALASTAVPQAYADNGEENQDTGIYWGNSHLNEGSYKMYTGENDLDAFGVDPGLSYPKQDGCTVYSDGDRTTLSQLIEDYESESGEEFSNRYKNQILASLYLGKMSLYGESALEDGLGSIGDAGDSSIVGDILLELIGNSFIMPDGAGPDEMAAAASSTIKESFVEGGISNGEGYDAPDEITTGTPTWESKALIKNLARIMTFAEDWNLNDTPIIENIVAPIVDVEVPVRTPEGDDSGKQRMIALNDIQLPSNLPGLSNLSLPAEPSDCTEYDDEDEDNNNDDGGNSTPPPSEENTNPEIRTSAEGSTGNTIESGTTVNDTVSYSGLESGNGYRLEARLMCKETGEDTGASKEHEFTASSASGEVTVEDIAVEDPDCLEQVVFQNLYDEEGYLVASHEDIQDNSQTVGGGTTGKKKKSSGEGMVTEVPSSPQTSQQQAQPERKIISNMPSGEGSSLGSTIFNR